jgi:predicted nucleic acid-binding protein
VDAAPSYFAAIKPGWTPEQIRFIARKVADLSRNYHLRGADAVHLASAIRLNTSFLMSNDNGFQHARNQPIEGVTVVTPQILWQETLDDSAN